MPSKAVFFAIGGILMLICQIISLIFLRKHKKGWVHPLIVMSPVVLMMFHPVVPEIIHAALMQGMGHKLMMTGMQWTTLWGCVYFWNKNRKAAICNIITLPLTVIDVIFQLYVFI